MAAAVAARRHGLEVMVVDEQPRPGGQIWRSIETASGRDAILGPAFVEGRRIARDFRASGAIYEPYMRLWQIEPGYRAYLSRNGRAECVEARTVVLATGAQERPVPFPGWTLPGVLTVGAAQILLKSAGEIPSEPVWVAGSGPLPLLYAVQLLRAGGRIACYLDTTPSGQWRRALRHLPRACLAAGDLLKGLAWTVKLRASVPVVRHIRDIAAIGSDRIEGLRYRTRRGTLQTAPCRLLLVHEGVVPNVHPALALDCETRWDSAQDCFAPVVDEWGESSRPNLFIAGDGAGIAGAKAAVLGGELTGIRIAARLGMLDGGVAEAAARKLRRRLDRELAARPFLDAMFKPRAEVFAPADDVLVCRCEEVTAGEIRKAGRLGCPGPNQIKAATRSGMGPCQGRQCGYSVTRLLAAMQGRAPGDVGFFHVRPPLKPVTLGELGSLHQGLGQPAGEP